MAGLHSGANWSTDFVEHVRTVHFTLIGVCAALLVLSVSRTQTEVQVAHQQIRQIRELVGMGRTYGENLAWTNWLQDGVRVRLKEWSDLYPPLFSRRHVLPLENNAIAFTVDDVTYRTSIIFDDNNSYLWDWKVRSWTDDMPSLVDQRSVWLRLNQPPRTLEEFRIWWNMAEQVLLDVPQLSKDAYVYTTVDSTSFPKPALQLPPKISRVTLSFLETAPVSWSPLGKGNMFLRDYTEQEIKNLRAIDPRFDAKHYYSGLLNFTQNNGRTGSAENRGTRVDVTIPVPGFMSVPYDAQSVLISHAKKEWDWKHGPFDYSFRELSLVTKEYEGITLEAGERVLAGEEKRTGESFEVLGVKLPAETITRWGIAAILAMQIYLWIHLRELSPKLRRNDPGWDVAWIGVYTSTHARMAMFALTCLLPLAAVLSVGIRGLYAGSFSKASWVPLILGSAATSTLGILAWKRLPRMSDRPAEHASESQS